MEREDNPYWFDGGNTILKNRGSQTKLISLICLAAISPLVLAWMQHNWPVVPNISYAMSLLTLILLAVFIPQGRARLWMPVLCVFVFIKFVVLSAFLDLIFNGFDGM